MPIKVLFICHGNICRSPMGEFIMKDLVQKAGWEERFMIASAATSTEEIGNPVYPPARAKLAEHGISSAGKTARQLRRADYAEYDYLIGMDDWNMRNIRRIIGADPEGKLYKLLDFTGEGGEIDDPWYTRDFDTAYNDILRGCRALLQRIREEDPL